MKPEENNLHKYWKESANYSDDNKPEDYLKHKDRSKLLIKMFEEFIPKMDKILELGCNSGRNLIQLYKKGYKNLSGVDINKHAIELLPDYIKAQCSLLEDYVNTMGDYDTVFSMAVFQHIAKESDFIFPIIAQKAKKIITIEDEVSNLINSHTARDYQIVFENLGFKQIKLYENIEDQTPNFRGRVFIHG